MNTRLSVAPVLVAVLMLSTSAFAAVSLPDKPPGIIAQRNN